MGARNRITVLANVCTCCGKGTPSDKPLPVTWDVHEVANADRWERFLRSSTRTVLTCSAECRAKVGLPERKRGVTHGNRS
jgi:hypothetical protein